MFPLLRLFFCCSSYTLISLPFLPAYSHQHLLSLVNSPFHYVKLSSFLLLLLPPLFSIYLFVHLSMTSLRLIFLVIQRLLLPSVISTFHFFMFSFLFLVLLLLTITFSCYYGHYCLIFFYDHFSLPFTFFVSYGFSLLTVIIIFCSY